MTEEDGLLILNTIMQVNEEDKDSEVHFYEIKSTFFKRNQVLDMMKSVKAIGSQFMLMGAMDTYFLFATN